MALRSMLAVAAAAWLAAPVAAQADRGKPGTFVDDLPAPRREIATEGGAPELPSVPAFVVTAVEAGMHAPRELRIRGAQLVGSEIKVKGYVTWLHTCPKWSIEKPDVCERPKLLLGDSLDAPLDSSISVVDLPRIKIEVGDPVIVTGSWALASPHGERNTGGLLVYKALERVAAAPATAATAATAATPTSTSEPAGIADPAATAEPDIAIDRPAPRKLVSNPVFNASVDHLNACTRAIAAANYDAGIAECRAAIEAWSDNHLAWYAWAGVYLARDEWEPARFAIERAVALRPDHAMYQLYLGVALYETHQIDGARDALRRAIKLDPALWRAHYYLGKLYRDLDDPARAAVQFGATVATHPADPRGYIALSELYRSWHFPDRALAVAQLGLSHAPASDAGALWFEAGMAHDAQRHDDAAIDAFSRAIAARPDDAVAKFQRGQVYLRRRQLAAARRDLAEVVPSSDPAVATIRPLAIQMIEQIDRAGAR